jgi:aminotransferase EvaB
VRHAARDAIMRALASRGVSTGVHYPWPIHRMPAYADLGYREGSLPVTERAALEIFSLPMFPSLTDEQQDRVCDAVRDVVSGM